MGYTHYFRRKPQPFPAAKWGDLTRDVAAILEEGARRGVKVAAEFDAPGQPPIVSPDLVCFNGIVSSDGEWLDWGPGASIFRVALGVDPLSPFEPERRKTRATR